MINNRIVGHFASSGRSVLLTQRFSLFRICKAARTEWIRNKTEYVITNQKNLSILIMLTMIKRIINFTQINKLESSSEPSRKFLEKRSVKKDEFVCNSTGYQHRRLNYTESINKGKH